MKIKQLVKAWLLPPGLMQLINRIRLFPEYFIFSMSVHGKKNDIFKGVHKGDRCFILGTGPSLKEQNLKLLSGEIVIGVSGIYQHKDLALFSPKYYVLPPIFKSHGHLFDEKEFISMLQDMDASLSDSTVLFLYFGDRVYIKKYKIFERKKIIWINYSHWERGDQVGRIELSEMPAVSSVSEVAIQVALYLNFDSIYILGFDHSWQDDIFKHFSENYNRHFSSTNLQACREWVDSEHEMIRHASIFNKYKKLFATKGNIFNANANRLSYVDTFPKITFEDLFK